MKKLCAFVLSLLLILSWMFLFIGCGSDTAAGNRNGEFNAVDFQAEDGSFRLWDLRWGSDIQEVEDRLQIEIPEEPFLSGEVYSMYEVEQSVCVCGYDAFLQIEFQENGPVIDHGLSVLSFSIQFEDEAEALKCYETLAEEFGSAIGETSERTGSDDKLNLKYRYTLWENNGEEHTILQLSTINQQVNLSIGLNP